MKKINTGLIGLYNLGIMDAIMGQLSDGKWENSPRMTKYCRNCSFDLNENNEVILTVKYDNIFTDKKYNYLSDKEILQWFGRKLKEICKDEERDGWNGIKWKRECDKISNYVHSYDYPNQKQLTYTIGYCYFIYDFLMGRDSNKYTGSYALGAGI